MTRPLGCVRHEKDAVRRERASHRWDTLHTPPSCIQVLTTNRKQKSNSVYLYFWNHSLTFLLSKYIIYILLEYIKYRIGTIPFTLPEYSYSSNCCKEQLVCNAHNFSFFKRFVGISVENKMNISPKNKV